MPVDHLTQFIPIACTGFGLLLIGGLNLLLLRRGLRARLLATFAAVGCALGAAGALAHTGLVHQTAQLLALGLAPCLLLASRPITSRASALVLAVHQPAFRFGLLMAGGIGLIIVSLIVFEQRDESSLQQSSDELQMDRGYGPASRHPRAMAVTDKGTRIVLQEPVHTAESADMTETEAKLLDGAHLNEQVIRRGPATARTNCHGWVFTAGRFMLTGEDVGVILADNGYEEVHQPEPGDLAIYRDPGGEIKHSAIVRYVAEGQPVVVEGKWSVLGVFLHPADKSIYGTDYAFYRSHRHGHLLAGIEESQAPPGQATATTTE